MVIRTNMAAKTATAYNTVNRGAASKSIEKLSSGYRINRAADDAAGLGISEKMQMQIREAEMVDANILQGYSVTQTADGALQEITDILQRVRELSVQASNGTYDTSNDRAALQKEIDSLFTEVKRITETADYNNIKLFDGEIKKVISDTTITISPTIWGNLDFIKETNFSPPPAPQKPATTLDLVGVNDATDLIGRAFTYTNVNGYVDKYYFCDNSTAAKVPYGFIAVNIQSAIATPGFAGVQAAFSNVDLDYASVKAVDGTPMQAMFEHDLRELQVSLKDPFYNNVVQKANGEWGNGTSVNTPPAGDTLLPVDGLDNKFVYKNDKQATLNFSMNGNTPLPFDNLKQNTLHLAGFTINFGPGTDTATEKFIPEAQCGTKDDIRAYLAGLSPLTNGNRKLIVEDANPNLKLTLTDSTNSLVNTYVGVGESVTSQPAITHYYPEAVGNSAGITQTVPGTNERNAEYELTIPEPTHNSTFRFSDSGGRSIYIYMYDSTQLNPPGKTPYMSGYEQYDINGKTKADVEAYIKGRMGSYLNVTSDGDKISFMYPTNVVHNITVASGGGKAYYQESGSSSSRVFGVDSYLGMEPASIDIDFADYFDAAGVFDKEALAKTGFKLNGSTYKFTTTASPATTGQNAINIESCNTIDDLKEALRLRTGFTPTNVDNLVTLTSGTRSTSSSKLTHVDGIEGVKPLFDVAIGGAKLSGGKNMGTGEAVIDFSTIKTAEDIDNLRNTGFRVRCATCPGEYINVLFVGQSTPPTKVPEFFEKEEPAGSGTIVKIKNIVIRTDEVTDPTKFASEIVRQANAVDPTSGKSALNHFTGMRVDPLDPSKLIAFDKRIGTLVNPNPPGEVQVGKVESGIEANFLVETSTYDEIIDGSIGIYVGSFGEHQYIDIPLKAISLDKLNLENASVESVAGANELLNRVTTAVNTISSARADIGAANNRLEKCDSVVENVKLNLAAADSRIKDVDMAKEMVTLTKYNILSESSAAILAQANTNHQSVLSLLK